MLANWSLDFTLDAEGLRTVDPLSLIMPYVQQTRWLHHKHTIIHAIIAELYTNALDHGILELPQTHNDSAKGFAAYQQEKIVRLNALTTGQLHFIVEALQPPKNVNNEILPAANPTATGRLRIEVIDSGKGFAYDKATERDIATKSYTGRGLILLKALCSELHYFGAGNDVVAILDV